MPSSVRLGPRTAMPEGRKTAGHHRMILPLHARLTSIAQLSTLKYARKDHC